MASLGQVTDNAVTKDVNLWQSKFLSFARLRQAGALTALVVFLTSCTGNSVHFESANKYKPEQIRAYLASPDGPGPFPAIMLLHGCTGLERTTSSMPWRGEQRHAAVLREAGFVTLIVDSHGSRGITADRAWSDSCRGGLGYRIRTEDVYGAIEYLQSLPNVNARAIGAVGFSQGAMVVMNSMSHLANAPERRGKLAAGVAFYPGCDRNAVKYGPYYNPLLLLIGDADDVTPLTYCQNIADEEQARKKRGDPLGDNFEMVVYPGVHHSFDLPLGRTYHTPIGTVAPNGPATTDARGRMITFFKRHLD